MSLKLNSGRQMPIVGLGVWKIPNDICAETVYQAIKAGYRLLDGAADYGNEVEAGQGLRRAIDEGIVKREDVFVTSKLWNTDHAKENVAAAAKRSLKDWGLDYFDLYLIHFPIALKHVPPTERYPAGWFSADGKIEIEESPIQDTWRELEKLHDEGLLKDIGISNFRPVLIMDILRYARVKPSVLQVELHPYNTQLDLVKFCEAFGIKITAYCSYGPQSWIELGSTSAKETPPLFDDAIVNSIATRHGKTAAQVLLRWATQRNIAIIPKSNNPKRLLENLNSLDFDLSQEEIERINTLDRGLRFGNPGRDFDPRLHIFA